MEKLKEEGKSEKDKDFFIACKDDKNDLVVYASDFFKLSEIDLINLIKVCLIEARNKTIGKKIMAIYRDSTLTRKETTNQRLEMIGIIDEPKPQPIKINKKTKFK